MARSKRLSSLRAEGAAILGLTVQHPRRLVMDCRVAFGSSQ
ncbi:hypothetical protein [Porphyrobacter sp. TH134]|nr:hypothetical protein [Porphyrobacter sp. TH134]